MSKTIDIPKGVVTSVNDESGIVIGTNITIQNVSNFDCILKESVSEPTESKVDYHLLSKKGLYGSSTEVATGSLEIWAYCEASDIKLSIEEI